jgi:8-amino-7-oxononanoate synthase
MQADGSLASWLGQAAERRRQRHLTRSRRPLRMLDAVRAHDGEQELLNFSSNDYLGLSGATELRTALAAAAEESGAGAGASALVTGYRPEHRALEAGLADYLERDAAVVFSSGYLANLAVATSLAGRGDCIVQDRLCHASLIDAARLSGAKMLRYPHRDLAGLERQLHLASGRRALVVTDGVFSMDGDLAPVEGISHLAGRLGASVIVDDAHGIGVIGPGGRGCVAAAGLGQEQVPVLVGTLGKAFGCAGAFVAGSRALVEHLSNEGRSYLFTTAVPPALAAAASAALERVRQDHWRREHLLGLVERFREGAACRSLPLLPSATPIQPLLTGSAESAERLAGRLRQRGFLVAAIRPPTVPPGRSRLRITLSAAHSAEQVDQLLDGIETCLESR